MDQATFGHPARYSYSLLRPRDDGTPCRIPVAEAGLRPTTVPSRCSAGSHHQIGTGIAAPRSTTICFIATDPPCWNTSVPSVSRDEAQLRASLGRRLRKDPIRDALLKRCPACSRRPRTSAPLDHHQASLTELLAPR